MSVLPGKLMPIESGRLAGGLLAAARPLPASTEDWRQGVTFTPNCSPNHGLAGCVNPSEAENKDAIDSLIEPAVFEPFMVYQGRECSTWVSTEELLSLSRDGLESTISGAFARQLQLGVVGGSPSLNSVATDITPLAPADVVNTFSGLVSAACECGINDLVFHVNIRAIPFLLERRLINWTGSTWKYGPWPVVADCYSETGPGDVETPPDGSEVWIYVTGPIEVAVSDEYTYDAIFAETNDNVGIVERLAILRFDPCCVQAARAEVF